MPKIKWSPTFQSKFRANYTRFAVGTGGSVTLPLGANISPSRIQLTLPTFNSESQEACRNLRDLKESARVWEKRTHMSARHTHITNAAEIPCRSCLCGCDSKQLHINFTASCNNNWSLTCDRQDREEEDRSAEELPQSSWTGGLAEEVLGDGQMGGRDEVRPWEWRYTVFPSPRRSPRMHHLAKVTPKQVNTTIFVSCPNRSACQRSSRLLEMTEGLHTHFRFRPLTAVSRKCTGQSRISARDKVIGGNSWFIAHPHILVQVTSERWVSTLVATSGSSQLN